MVNWYIGQKVVCIADGWVARNGEACPQKDKIYTIREIMVESGEGCLRFNEIRNTPNYYLWNGVRILAECAFHDSWFRPLEEKKKGTETGMTILNKILTDANEKRKAKIDA